MIQWSVGPFAGPDAEWNAFGGSQTGWTAFHRIEWRAILSSLYGHECPFLCARDESGRLGGILPLVRVRSRLFGHYLVSMPFVSYGGPLGEPEAVRALVASAVGRARADGVRLLELRSSAPLPIDLPVSHRKITVVLPLTGGPEAVLKRLPAKVRSQTRRPFKDGLTVRFGADVVRDFHRVFAHHMRDLGTPAQPLAFFEAIADQLRDVAWFGCAYLGEHPVAAGAGFRFGDEFEITWASALREHNRISANMGLYWAFIERAAAAGIARFNFGRCTPGSATHRFKTQWGAEDLPLWWYQHAPAGPAATPSADSPKFRMATQVWRRLPLSVAGIIGPRVVRYLP